MKQPVLLFLKGLAMGAADVVPGVSGGTIAFISGIYEELLASIRSVDAVAFRLLVRLELRAFWEKVNGKFLLPLLAGMGVAIVSLARLVLYLLANHPIGLWSFFFGLILASAWLVAQQVRRWKPAVWGALLVGTSVAYYVAGLQTPAEIATSLPYLFLCGMIAICAMILPGISGSFILLLMGAYETVVGAIKQLVDSLLRFNLAQLLEAFWIVLTFGAGCLVGLAAFSRVLTWLFQRYHDALVALLIGFLLGSLNKIWPWKVVAEQLTEKHASYQNVGPASYEALSGNPAQIGVAIALLLAGFALVYGLSRWQAAAQAGNA